MYVAYVPALDVSSCGSTDEEARKNIRDAVRGFLAASAGMGTLDEILLEAGYEREGGQWHAQELAAVDLSIERCSAAGIPPFPSRRTSLETFSEPINHR